MFPLMYLKDADPVGAEADPQGARGGEGDDRGAGVRRPRLQLRLRRAEQQEDPQLRMGQLPTRVSTVMIK